ncbi:MAG: 3'-5' exonuclease [bacterium]|nr:3'-5' exonuclease [bacterium]
MATESRLLVFDIETVPDHVTLEGATKALKPVSQKIVAISFVLARIEKDGGKESYFIEECRSGGTAQTDEKELISGFWRLFEREKPRLVSWNGRGFDVPVLQARAMVHGVPTVNWHTAGDRWNGYRSRYSPDWHCDLMDVLSDYGAAPRMGLQETAIGIGLPGKLIASGGEVAELVEAGDIEHVRSYCECDVLNLFCLYVRWALISGRCTVDRHDSSLGRLVDYLQSHRVAKPHFGEFFDRWSQSSQPCPAGIARSIFTGG